MYLVVCTHVTILLVVWPLIAHFKVNIEILIEFLVKSYPLKHANLNMGLQPTIVITVKPQFITTICSVIF